MFKVCKGLLDNCVNMSSLKTLRQKCLCGHLEISSTFSTPSYASVNDAKSRQEKQYQSQTQNLDVLVQQTSKQSLNRGVFEQPKQFTGICWVWSVFLETNLNRLQREESLSRSQKESHLSMLEFCGCLSGHTGNIYNIFRTLTLIKDNWHQDVLFLPEKLDSNP